MNTIGDKINEEIIRLGKILDDPRDCYTELIRGKIKGLIFSLKLMPINQEKNLNIDLVSCFSADKVEKAYKDGQFDSEEGKGNQFNINNYS